MTNHLHQPSLLMIRGGGFWRVVPGSGRGESTPGGQELHVADLQALSGLSPTELSMTPLTAGYQGQAGPGFD